MRSWKGGCAIAALLTGMSGGVVYAQTSPGAAAAAPATVEELVVNARKREERLRDVPIAATVIDQRLIEDQGQLRTMENLLANAPSVHFLDTNSTVNSEVSIRGSGTSRGTNAEAAVGLYRDGAYIGGGALGGRTFSQWDLFDVQRADVLRGTQGALFGRNAVGGAINVITQKPTFERGGRAFAQYGTNEYKQLDLILNAPITDHLAVRLSTSASDQSKGFFFNPSRNTYYDATNASGERLQVRFKQDRFDGTLLAEHYQAQLTPVMFRVVIPNGTSAAFPGGYVQAPYSYPHNGSDVGKQQINDVQATWSYNFDFGRLDSSTLYRDRRSLFAFDSDAVDAAELTRIRAANTGAAATTDPNGQSVTADRTRDVFQDLHLSGDIGSRFNYVGGFEYLKLDSHSSSATGRTPTPASSSIGTVAPATLTIRSKAIYGLIGAKVSPTVDLSVEGRFTEDERGIAINRFDRGTGVIVTPSRFSVTGTNKPRHFNYTATADWKFLPEWLLYAKVGTAFRAGSFNTDQGDPRGAPIPVAYNDEQATTYEVGAKGNLGRPLFVALTAFRTNTKNALVQKDNGCRATNPACPVAATNYLINGGEVELNGQELEATYRQGLLGGDLRLNGGVSHLEGKIISGIDVGKEPARIPRWQLKLNVNYRHLVAGRMFGFANVRYASESGGKQEINPDMPIPFSAATPTGAPTGAIPAQLGPNLLHDHQLTNLRIGVQQDRWEAAFYADNATDERYIVNQTATTNRLNQPRRIGIQVRVDF